MKAYDKNNNQYPQGQQNKLPTFDEFVETMNKQDAIYQYLKKKKTKNLTNN